MNEKEMFCTGRKDLKRGENFFSWEERVLNEEREKKGQRFLLGEKGTKL